MLLSRIFQDELYIMNPWEKFVEQNMLSSGSPAQPSLASGLIWLWSGFPAVQDPALAADIGVPTSERDLYLSSTS